MGQNSLSTNVVAGLAGLDIRGRTPNEARSSVGNRDSLRVQLMAMAWRKSLGLVKLPGFIAVPWLKIGLCPQSFSLRQR